MQDVELGPLAVGQGAGELQDLRVEGRVLRGEVLLDVEQVRLVRGRCRVDGREDLREGPVPVAGLTSQTGQGQVRSRCMSVEPKSTLSFGSASFISRSWPPLSTSRTISMWRRPRRTSVETSDAVLAERLGELVRGSRTCLGR